MKYYLRHNGQPDKAGLMNAGYAVMPRYGKEGQFIADYSESVGSASAIPVDRVESQWKLDCNLWRCQLLKTTAVDQAGIPLASESATSKNDWEIAAPNSVLDDFLSAICSGSTSVSDPDVPLLKIRRAKIKDSVCFALMDLIHQANPQISDEVHDSLAMVSIAANWAKSRSNVRSELEWIEAHPKKTKLRVQHELTLSSELENAQLDERLLSQITSRKK